MQKASSLLFTEVFVWPHRYSRIEVGRVKVGRVEAAPAQGTDASVLAVSRHQRVEGVEIRPR